MSRAGLTQTPLIHLVHRAHRAFQAHMVRAAHAGGNPEVKPAHNALFAILGRSGDRAANLAARAGVTRQSMGEVIRDLVELGILEMVPDPEDRRAKIVRYTAAGEEMAGHGARELRSLEELFTEEFGVEGYQALRRGLERVATILADLDGEPEPQG